MTESVESLTDKIVNWKSGMQVESLKMSARKMKVGRIGRTYE